MVFKLGYDVMCAIAWEVILLKSVEMAIYIMTSYLLASIISPCAHAQQRPLGRVIGLSVGHSVCLSAPSEHFVRNRLVYAELYL